MGLKEYRVGKLTYQYDEDRVPSGAVPVKQAAAPKNKSRTPRSKTDPAVSAGTDEKPGDAATDGDPATGDSTDGDW